jgi:hypothetical protein
VFNSWGRRVDGRALGAVHGPRAVCVLARAAYWARRLSDLCLVLALYASNAAGPARVRLHFSSRAVDALPLSGVGLVPAPGAKVARPMPWLRLELARLAGDAPPSSGAGLVLAAARGATGARVSAARAANRSAFAAKGAHPLRQRT